MKGVIVTVVLATVLALLFVALLLNVAFSGWGDRSLRGAYIRNELQSPVVVFLCDQQRAAADCRGIRLAARSTDVAYLTYIGRTTESFAGDVVVTNEKCEVVSRTETDMAGDFAVVITPEGVDARGDISPFSERYAPGFSQAPGFGFGSVSCPDLGYG